MRRKKGLDRTRREKGLKIHRPNNCWECTCRPTVSGRIPFSTTTKKYIYIFIYKCVYTNGVNGTAKIPVVRLHRIKIKTGFENRNFFIPYSRFKRIICVLKKKINLNRTEKSSTEFEWKKKLASIGLKKNEKWKQDFKTSFKVGIQRWQQLPFLFQFVKRVENNDATAFSKIYFHKCRLKNNTKRSPGPIYRSLDRDMKSRTYCVENRRVSNLAATFAPERITSNNIIRIYSLKSRNNTRHVVWWLFYGFLRAVFNNKSAFKIAQSYLTLYTYIQVYIYMCTHTPTRVYERRKKVRL